MSSDSGMPLAIARVGELSATRGEHERRPVRRHEARRPLEERADDLAADGAGADDADAQGLNAHEVTGSERLVCERW